MPVYSDDEIRELITKGEIGAVAFDTNVFEPGRNLRSPIIRSLDQFGVRPERVLMPDVVAKEMVRHLAQSAASTQRGLKKQLREHNRRWFRDIPAGEQKSLLLEEDPLTFAENELRRFCAEVGAEVIDAASVPDITSDVLERYFAETPPFGSGEDRKREFPDAYALLALDSFARTNGCYVLCISADKGWIEFARDSDWLICVGRISDAIALFHDHIKASEVVQKWRDGGAGEHLDRVVQAFDRYLDGISFDVEAHADLFYEAEGYEAAIQFVDPATLGDPKVLSVDDETVTFSVIVNARIKFTALFTFYVHDSIDREYTQVNSDELTTEDEISVQLVITAMKEVRETPDFLEVEVEPARLVANFGHVEAISDDDPTNHYY